MRLSLNKTILVFAQQAGTAAILIPVLERLRCLGYHLEIYALPPAMKLLRKEFDNIFAWDGFPKKEYNLMLTGYGNPRLKINREIFRHCKGEGLKNIALLDSWKGLERFSEADGSITEDFPDILTVIDKETEDVLIKMGIPSDSLVVTGHPQLELISDMEITGEKRSMARMVLGLPLDKRVYFLASEILHFHPFHESCNVKCCGLYDLEVTGILLWQVIQEKNEKDALFIMRPHPNEQKGKYIDGIRCIDWEDVDEITVLCAVDGVFGLSSMFVQNSVAMGVPTYNVEPLLNGWKPQNSYLCPELWNHLVGNGYLGDWKNVKASKPGYKGAIKTIVSLIENQIR